MSRLIVKLQPTDVAWLVLVAYVLGVNITLPEQLSMAMDRYARKAIAVTAVDL